MFVKKKKKERKEGAGWKPFEAAASRRILGGDKIPGVNTVISQVGYSWKRFIKLSNGIDRMDGSSFC